jgi:hypothetical protein
MTEKSRMITKLIKLEDGTLVEVEVLADQPRQIAAGTADKVAKQFDAVKPILMRVCKPISEAWNEINQDMNIDQAEVQLSLSFEAEGNLCITKSKANANITVKLVLKPKPLEKIP